MLEGRIDKAVNVALNLCDHPIDKISEAVVAISRVTEWQRVDACSAGECAK